MHARTALRPATEVLAGLTTAARGMRAWVRAPRLMALGMIPGVVTALVLGGGLVVLAFHLRDIGRAIARVVGLEDGFWADLASVSASAAVLVGSMLVAVALFTTLTLAIGGPFFEAISKRVDDAMGGLGVDEVDEPWTRALRRGITEGVVTVGISIGVSLLVLAVGLVPVVGTVTAFTLGALVGGRLLVIELTAFPLARRGVLRRRDRIALLRPYRWRAGALGVLTYLVFLVPVVAMLTMPIAVVSATLLVRDITRTASPSPVAPPPGLPGSS